MEPFTGAALDIGCRAYIGHIRAAPYRTAEGCEMVLDVRIVSESADDLLEIYALVEGQTLAYYRRREHWREMTHQLRIGPIAGRPTSVNLRVDLVNGATIWDTVEVPLAIPS